MARVVEPLRVGLYARISTHDQQTLPLQVKAMRQGRLTKGEIKYVWLERLRWMIPPTRRAKRNYWTDWAACWESEHEPVITFFTDDGDVWGFPFFGLLAAQYTARNQTLALQLQGAQVRIQGPRAHDFFMAFAKGSATGIKANGEDILSVEVILPPSPPPAANGEKEKMRPE